jgi:hypothetical protein
MTATWPQFIQTNRIFGKEFRQAKLSLSFTTYGLVALNCSLHLEDGPTPGPVYFIFDRTSMWVDQVFFFPWNQLFLLFFLRKSYIVFFLVKIIDNTPAIFFIDNTYYLIFYFIPLKPYLYIHLHNSHMRARTQTHARKFLSEFKALNSVSTKPDTYGAQCIALNIVDY